ncbi:MAG: hypothetical protein AAF390_00515 [Pseudomonadota bacterium]
MTDPLPSDWAEALRRQGVPPEEIAEAQRLAARHAKAAACHPHDPLASAGPDAFLAFLRDQAR